MSIEIVTTEGSTANGFDHKVRWRTPSLAKLNRSNKINSTVFTLRCAPPPPPASSSSSSSSSGVVPSTIETVSTVTQYHFRLCLLRGVIAALEEKDDPIALYIEYVPMPPPAEEGQAAVAHPGQCRIRASCYSPSESAVAVFTREASCTFNHAETTVAMKDFLPAVPYLRGLGGPNASEESPVLNAAGGTLIEFHLTTNVPLVEELKQTRDKVAAGLWSFFSKGVEAVSKAVTVVTSEAQAAMATHLAARNAADATSTGTGSGPGASRPLPWEEIPERWSQRAEAWVQLCVETLPQNEWTFLSSPQRVFTPDEQLHLASYGLNHASLTPPQWPGFDFDRDVNERLLGDARSYLRAIRFDLVPRLITDEEFWHAYFWKVAALSHCHSDEQTRILLSILNAPQPLRSKSRSPGAATDDAGDFAGSGGGVAASDSTHQSPAGAASGGTDEAYMKPAWWLPTLDKADDSASLCLEMLEEGNTNLSGDVAFKASLSAVKKAQRDIRAALAAVSARADRGDAQPVISRELEVRARMTLSRLDEVARRWEEPPAVSLAALLGTQPPQPQVVASAEGSEPPAANTEHAAADAPAAAAPSPVRDASQSTTTPSKALQSSSAAPAPTSTAATDKEDSDDFLDASPAAVAVKEPSSGAPASGEAASSQPRAASGSTSAFAKMPWEEDDD